MPENINDIFSNGFGGFGGMERPQSNSEKNPSEKPSNGTDSEEEGADPFL